MLRGCLLLLIVMLGVQPAFAHARPTPAHKSAPEQGKARSAPAKGGRAGPGKAAAKGKEIKGKPAAKVKGKPIVNGKPGGTCKPAVKGKEAARGREAGKGRSAATGKAADEPKAAHGKRTSDGVDAPAARKAHGEADAEPKPLTAKDKKKRAALAATCATARGKKTAACKAFLEDEKERAQAAQRAALKKTCALAKNKKSKQCKAFLVAERRGGATSGACGRKYGIARKNEKVAAFARRFRIAEARLRDWNDLGSAGKLKGGKRYLVYKSPHDGVTLQGGVLLEAEPDAFALQRPYRGWGKPLLVETLRLAVHQVLAAAPEGTTLVFGDLSKEGGGCLAPHKSHRGGLDADVGFFYRGAQQRHWLGVATAETLDADRTWLLIKAMLATGRLQMAFLDYGLQPPLYEAALRAGETPQTLEPIFQYPRPIERAHETVIRHLGGHDNHMHVRFVCPSDAECALPEDSRQRLTSVRMEQRGGVMDETVPHRPARRPTGPLPDLMP